MSKISLTRRYRLPALHQLAGEGCSADENLQIFGPCSRLHGHEYEIEVTLFGELSPASGLLVNRDQLDQIVQTHILGPFTGSNLSHHFVHTTGEALALAFYQLLKPHFAPPLVLTTLTVNETAKNSFIVGG